VRNRHFAFAAVLIIATAAIQFAQTPDSARYQLPPKEIIEAFDAAPLPAAVLSPSKQVVALTYRRAYPVIAELSQPILRLAGARVNPNTNGPQRTANIYGITLKKISDGSEIKVTVPPQANFEPSFFAGWKPPVISQHQTKRHRVVDRRCRDGPGKAPERNRSTERHHRRPVRLVARQ
jgi:hypothetical protein